MTIAIIGGAGFVGTRLTKVFDEQAVRYSIFDKVLVGANYLDITKPETFETLPSPKIVINLAAEHRDNVTPKSLYDLVNVEGSKNVCEFCRRRGVNKIVFTSSVAVYGFAPEDTDETGEINYFNDYGRTKYLAENVYKEWFDEDPKNRTLVIVRPTVIFGEGNRGNVYNLLNQIARRRFVMIGAGKNRKSMAYIQNIAELISHEVQFAKGYRLINYADKPDLSTYELVEIARAELLGKNNIGFRIPGWCGLMAGTIFDLISKLNGKNYPISNIRVRKFLGTTTFTSNANSQGFVPKYSLIQGLKKTISSDFKKNRYQMSKNSQ